MDKRITRVFSFDGDTCEVVFQYDADFGKYFGDYPDFEETPKFTSGGWPWVTAMQEGCAYSENKSGDISQCFDCGSCIYYRQERQGDLIGICMNEKNRNFDREGEER